LDIENFKEFVEVHRKAFTGCCHEHPDALASYEKNLMWELPESLKWLLKNYGYSDFCGVENLGESVEHTMRLRRDIDLPKRILLLSDWGDAGVVMMVKSPENLEPKVIWTDVAGLYNVMWNSPPGDADVFENFASWVVYRYETLRDE